LDLRPVVKSELLEQVKEKYPEVKGLTTTAVIDWALRKVLNEVKK
jgi:hypothetical protein